MKEKLDKILKKYNISINSKGLQQFEDYYKYMLEYNQTHNLTSITEENDVILKHYLDSVLPYTIFKNNANVIDLGCGAGFPSIPLKIMRNDLNFLAVDSVNKKVEFVNNTKNLLNLDNFTAIHARIEDLAKDKNHREKYDYVVSRAVAPLNIILEYSAPMLKNGGFIISYKGINYQEEINQAHNALNILNCEIVENIDFYIEELDTYRTILVIKKKSNIPSKYPRDKNKPRLNPL